MADSFLQTHKADGVTSSEPLSRVRWLVMRLAVATLLLMAVGSATRVMNAGLACPDWPLCYGQLLPHQQMNLRVFLEWFHRLDAAVVSLGAIALAATSWWHRQSLPHWYPWLSTLAVLLVGVQASLGALTVTELLRFDLVTAHLGTALLFFSLLVFLGTALVPYQASDRAGPLGWIGLAATICVYLQSILGGLVASRWALHQCFEAAQLCRVMNGHILGLILPTLAIAILAIGVWRTPALPNVLRHLANLAGGLLLLQIVLGYATFRLHLQVEPLTVAHQAVGAALLGASIAFTVLAYRDRTPPQSGPADNAHPQDRAKRLAA